MPLTFAAIATADRLDPLGFEQVTAGLAAAQNLPNIPDDAEVCIIQPVGGAIRFRDDGTSPTDSIGLKVGDGETVQYPGDLAALEFIADSGSAVSQVNVSYYRYGV